MPSSVQRIDHGAKTNLGQPGYRAVLVNLPPNLKEHEGATTRSIETIQPANPERKSSGVYNIIATQDHSDKEIHISLRGKYLDPFLDRAGGGAGSENAMKLELAKLHKDGYYTECLDKADGGAPNPLGELKNNRSSVKVAYTKFIQQLRNAIKDRSTDKHCTVSEVLLEMDEDGNGVIDKHELLLGAHTLGINITPIEMDMIWPMFGPFDSSGSIKVKRFVKAVKSSQALGSSSSAVQALESQESTMLALQRANRTERISKKTKLVAKLAKLSISVRTRLLAILREHDCGTKAAFVLLDTDRSGTIDKQEFFAGLQRLGVKITDTELDGVWPMFSLEKDGTIGKKEWAKFMEDKVGWSYKLMADRFSNLINHDEGRNATEVYEKLLRMNEPTYGIPDNPRPTRTAPARASRTAPKPKPKARKKKAAPRYKVGPAGGSSHMAVSPNTHKAFGGSALLYRRQSVTRGYVVEPVFSA